MNMKLPFSHLNLQFNPFGELTREDRSVVAHVDLDTLPKILKQEKQAIQFIGDHGRGKSTHLIALHNLFSNAPYTQLYEGDKPRFKKVDIQFVDSIDYLPQSKRKRLYRKSTSLACTTHVDLTSELSEFGYTVHTREISQVDTLTLHRIFTNRIEFSRREAGEIPTINSEAIDILKEKFKDDIRAMETHLYEIFQSMKEIQDVQV